MEVSGEQGSEEWLKQRSKCITSSEVASILFRKQESCQAWIIAFGQYEFVFDGKEQINPFKDIDAYIAEKTDISPKYFTNPAIEWGKLYEPAAREFYKELTHRDVFETNLLIHKTHPFIGASPDGITNDDRMLEIKCPLRRFITRVPPLHYWVQMQIQMEVADIDVCDYMDVKIDKYDSIVKMLYDHDTPESRKGCCLTCSTEKKPFYPYAYVSLQDKIDTCTFMQKSLTKHEKECVFHCYKISHFCITPVYRNKDWFKDNLNFIQDTWNKIEKLRQRD